MARIDFFARRGDQGIQQIVRSDAKRSVGEVPLDLWKERAQSGDPFRCSSLVFLLCVIGRLWLSAQKHTSG